MSTVPVIVPAAPSDYPNAPLKIAIHNVVHLRAEPRSGTELVSQTLMGRYVRVLKNQDNWSWVESDDTYRGWAESRWLVDSASQESLQEVTQVFTDLRESPEKSASLVERLPMLVRMVIDRTEGDWSYATLPGKASSGWLQTAALTPLEAIPVDSIGACATEYGREFRGTPYLWGGSSSFGLDCSGFVQLSYRMAGVLLRRDADIQRDDPRFVPVAQTDLQPGDLVFFGKPDKITHVGMHFVGNTFIHSAGGAGVIFSEWGDERYSPSYVDARRLDPARAAEPVTRFEADNR